MSRKPPIAVSGTRIERNAIVSRISARPTTTARYGMRLSAIRCETSMLVAVWPVTSTSRRSLVSRIVLTRFSVASRDGPLDGVTEISARFWPGLPGRARRRRRPAAWPAPSTVALGVAAGDDRELAVDADAEALGDEVVGLALGGVGVRRSRRWAGRGGRRARGSRARRARSTTSAGGDHRAAHDERDPAGAERACGRRPANVLPRDDAARRAKPSSAGTSVRLSEHGDGDRAGGGDAHLGEERHAGDDERDEGDDHRRAGEHDGAAGGADGERDRLGDVHAVAHLRAVAGEDEQRVVDADGEAEHRRRACVAVEVRSVKPLASCDAEHADADADDRGQQRQAGGEQRAERDRRARSSRRSRRAPRRSAASLATGAADPPNSTCGAALAAACSIASVCVALTSACLIVNCRSV